MATPQETEVRALGCSRVAVVHMLVEVCGPGNCSECSHQDCSQQPDDRKIKEMLERAEDVLAGRTTDDADIDAAPEPVIPESEVLHQAEDEHERVDPAQLLPDDDASGDSDVDANKSDTLAAEAAKPEEAASIRGRGRGRGRGAKAGASKASSKPVQKSPQKREFSTEVKRKVENERARCKPVGREITKELAEPGLGRDLHGGSTSSRAPPSRTGGDKRKAKDERKPDKDEKRKKQKK